jgi:hypothetical protein
MTKSNGWLAIGGISSLFATAEAQTLALSTAMTAFDGTYAFVSSTRVTETYMNVTGRMGQCPEGRAGSLTIINGQARLPIFEGTVGSQGELMMRRIPEPFGRHDGGAIPGLEGIVSGRIDKDGTIKARRMTGGCNYDMIWRKESK